jgi:uncharacterized protein YjbI with pentapeptide repeats
MTYRSRYLESKKKYLHAGHQTGGEGESDNEAYFREEIRRLETVVVRAYSDDAEFVRVLNVRKMYGVKEPSVKSISFQIARITNASIELIGSLKDLENLSFRGCDQITDEGLAHLGKLSKLQSLELTDCDRITDAGLVHVSQLLGLTSLDLSFCDKITDDGMAHISRLSGLRNLRLRRSKITDRGCNITDKGLVHVSQLLGLTSLDLSFCDKITDDGMAHISRLSRLQKLSLSGCGITDAGLTNLNMLADLEDLDLSHCHEINGSGIAKWDSLKKLDRLTFEQCSHFDGAHLKHIGLLHNLMYLNLVGCQITDKHINAWLELNQFNKLDRLVLSLHGQSITKESVAKLSKYTYVVLK